MATTASKMALDAHDARVVHDLECLNFGSASWVRATEPLEAHVYDAIIVGGGQSGLGAAFGLLRERISNILIIDENAAGKEGPWDTYARMRTLRTPKHLTSIDLGVPSLTFRAWWEAIHGPESWDKLDRISRQDWMKYLRWYRRILRLPMRNDVCLKLIEPVRRGLFRLHLGDDSVLLARKVVLATGIQGGGEWHVPDMIRQKIPASLYSHSSENIDYEAHRGRRLGILGGGASAFDNAQHALNCGAREVHVFVRRKALPRVNQIRFMATSGIIPNFPALPDAAKYAMLSHFFDRNQPPTNDAFRRAAASPGFYLHLAAPWLDVTPSESGVSVRTPDRIHQFDFLVLATGLVTDPALRPELAIVADRIARWADRFVEVAESRHPLIDAHPYLGPGFEYLPRRPEDADMLHGLFAFNYSGLVSLGLAASALSSLTDGLSRLTRAVASQLFLDDQEEILANYLNYAEAEFVGDQEPATP